MNTRFDRLIRVGGHRIWFAGVALLSLCIALLVSETGAQDAPRDVNSIAPENAPVAAAQEAVSFGEVPQGFLWSVNGELVPAEEVAAGRPPAEPATVSAGGSGTKYYLTDDNLASDAALAACAAGYHMASLWEIIDPSNLTYAFDHPDAHTKADDGEGPPSEWFGRVRTGASSSVANSAGSGNCAAWTSVDNGHYGTFVRLTPAWEAPPGEIGGIWDAHAFSCNLPGPVWCVADFHALYLPAIMNP